MPDNSFAKISLSSYQGRTVVLFFYPLDFTFVCPAEIIAFDKTIEEFASRQCQVIGLSVDSVYARLAWRNTPRSAGGTALRGLFLIDRKGIVRHELVNDQGLGRNVDEALQVTETHGEVCPANWRSGEAGVQPTTQGVAA